MPPSPSPEAAVADAPAPDEADPDLNGSRVVGQGPPAPTRWKRTTHKWSRWLHVYTSMISLLLVLFFGITGITLNHPDWTFGADPVRTTTTGQLPDEAIVDGNVEFLVVSEFLRNTADVKGEVKAFADDGGEGTISFKNPGYSADVFFDTETGEYELLEVQQGWLNVLNELHKGRDGDSNWRWIIDVSGGLLVLISVTGLGIQFFLRKRRRSALSLAAAGTVITIILILLALN